MSSNHRWMSWGRIAAAVVLLAIVAVVAWLATRRTPASVTAPATVPGASNAPATPSAPDANTRVEAVNDRIRREIVTEGLTVDRARQLFVLEVTSLPGVVPPDGPVNPTFSGTYALTQLEGVRAELTPEQRARLDELLDTSRNTLPPNLPPIAPPTLPPPYEGPAAPRTPVTAPKSVASLALPAVRALPASLALPVSHAPSASGGAWRMPMLPGEARLDAASLVDPPTQAEIEEQYRNYFQPLYHWANAAVSQLTGQPLVPGFVLSFGPRKDWVVSWTWEDGKRVRGMVNGTEENVCASQIDITKFQNQPLDVQLSVIVHEVTHCYQQLTAYSAADVESIHPWIHDGEAMWAQMEIVPGAVFERLQTHWAEYILAPNGHLFERGYDASGFFGHVADVSNRILVAVRLIAVFKAGAGGNDKAAYDTLVAGIEDKVLDTWASSYFRTHEQQFLWTAKSPGIGNLPSATVAPHKLTVASGDSVPLNFAPPWELSLVSLDTSSDIVMIASGQGHVSLIDRTEQVQKTLAPFEPIALCVKGDCKCPPDAEGDPPQALPALAQIDIGLTGGTTGAYGWAHGLSLQDFCSRKPVPSPHSPPAAHGGGPQIEGPDEPHQGIARSDPHMITLDGRWYDLQSKGEFVLSKSTVDDFLVQVRFGQIGSIRNVSIATAMATKVGKDRITVTLDQAGASPVPILRINGQRVTDDYVFLAGGSVRAVFSEGGTGYTIERFDRTRVGIGPFARQGLNVWVIPPEARKGKLTGLLGDGDGNPANDPVVAASSTTTSSVVLKDAPSYDELYGAFANSWRISAAESLFDYKEGENTETFTDRAFPDRDAPAPDAATMAMAETSCKSSGIADERLLRSCAYDVATTGNKAFARAYRPTQQRADAAAALRGTGMVTSVVPSSRTKNALLEGRVTDATADAFATFQGYKGDIVYLDPTNCLKPRFMQLLGPDRKLVGGNAPACGMRQLLPADGVYTVSMNPFKDFAGVYRLSFVTVRPDRVTTIKAGDVMSGTLSARAEQDVFLVPMRGPGSITLGGDGCRADFDAAIYYGDDELIGAGPACRIGQVKLPKAGTYRIVLNPFNNSPGSYRVPTS